VSLTVLFADGTSVHDCLALVFVMSKENTASELQN